MVLIENLYKLFGSSQPLSQAVLKRRYRDLSKLLHPDKQRNKAGKHIANLFSSLTGAYNLLSDKDFKRYYDKLLVRQLDSIEFINPIESTVISLSDCEFADIDLKLKFALYGLTADFNIEKFKIIVNYFLRLNKGSTLNLIREVSEKINNKFYDFYFDILYEVLLNNEEYFSKYIDFFETLVLSENQVEILGVCKVYSNNVDFSYQESGLIKKYNYKLIHLMEIKKIEKSE